MSRPLRPGIILVGVAFLALLIKGLILDLAVVEGPSMEPTLAAGRLVLVFRAAYGLRLPPAIAPRNGYFLRWGKPCIGEVVAARSPRDGGQVVKRIVAEGPLLLHVEWNRLEGSGFAIGLEGRTLPSGTEMILARDEYFLAGDNASRSIDSRDYGSVSSFLIVGRVVGVPEVGINVTGASGIAAAGRGS